MLLAVGIKEVFGRIGLDLSDNPLVLEPRTVVVSLVVGVLVTLTAAYLPARRAGSVSPVAAMRDDVTLAESGLKWRITVGAVLLAAGIAGMAAGLLGVGSEPTYVLGAGAFGVLVGTALLSPVLGRPVLAGLGWVYRRGVRGGRPDGRAEHASQPAPHRRHGVGADDRRLARDDDGGARSVGQGQPRQDAGRGHHRRLRRDQPRGQPFSSTVADDVAEVPGVAQVAQVRGALLQVDGNRDFATAVDPVAIDAVARPR